MLDGNSTVQASVARSRGHTVRVFQKYIYLDWIYDANDLESICHLKIYVDIGYIMPTFGGLM